MNRKSFIGGIVMLFSMVTLGQDLKRYAPDLLPEHISSQVCGFSLDGSTIYFARTDSTGRQWLYKAERNKDKWINAQPLRFSGDYSDFGARLSKDGNTMYFTSNRPGGSDLVDDEWNIWVSKLVGGFWADPEPVKAINNMGSECCVAPIGEDRILFSSSPQGINDWKIYEWNKGTTAEIKPLNAEGAWQWPSYYDDGVLLMNSMKRSEAIGKDDLYLARYERGSWTNPVIFKEPINSTIYEDGAILTPDGKYLIFCKHDSWNTPSVVYVVEFER